MPRTSSFHAPNVRQQRLLVVVAVVIVAAIILAVGGGPSVLLAAAIIGATGYRRIRRTRGDQQHRDDSASVQTGLNTLTAELRVGAHPAAACASAASECREPVASVFRGAAARARLGGSAAAGFRGASGIATESCVRIAAVWTVAERYGLALAELLHAVQVDMQGRERFRRRTEASLAGARATAAVLAGLPILGIGLGQLMGASPLKVLLGGGIGG
ncbi:MAG: secretion protein F, partial [Rhodococcus sp.]|nr:secretion protein F [Rhodococcus sp. (in: high G+C Gram-positive bacteria)]